MLVLLFAILVILAITTYWLSRQSTNLALVVAFVMLFVLGLILVTRMRNAEPQPKKTTPLSEKSKFKDPALEYDTDVSVTDTQNISVQRNVAYGDDPKQVLDLCKPKTLTSKAPLIILIHGGGGDKVSYISSCQRLAQSGYFAATVNYREDPPPAYPKALDDVRDALSYLLKLEQVDTKKVGAMGGSAGGYLSSMLGTQEENQKVACVVNQFGPTDLTDPSILNLSIWKSRLFPKMFGNVTYEENPELYKNASPITYVSANDADFFFTRSVNDPLVPKSQAERMIAALRSVGKQVANVYEFNGTGGGHATKLPSKDAEKLWNMQINFLDSCLGVK